MRSLIIVLMELILKPATKASMVQVREFYMNRLVGIGLCALLSGHIWSANAYVFVSFSMPEPLMSETLTESARLHIPALLNGLIDNSMPQTVKKIQILSTLVPNLDLQIDPTAFERFGITQVPALVVEQGGAFDVLYGNLTLKEGLRRLAHEGESGFSEANARSLIGD
jgi:conjugal transfer pilus assembly protein TrbC